MDGNRRFAESHLGTRDAAEGHAAGYAALLSALEWCLDLGVRTVSVFAFSVDNFSRPQREVDALMELAREKLGELAGNGSRGKASEEEGGAEGALTPPTPPPPTTTAGVTGGAAAETGLDPAPAKAPPPKARAAAAAAALATAAAAAAAAFVVVVVVVVPVVVPAAAAAAALCCSFARTASTSSGE